MKKNFPQLLAVLLIVFTAFSFSSCRSNDNDDFGVNYAPDDPNVPKVIMKTSIDLEEYFGVGFVVSQDTVVEVDWGDGERVKIEVPTGHHGFSRRPKGNTVKVYYDHDHVKLFQATHNEITEIDLKNAIGLERLELNVNKISKLAISKNTKLNFLYLQDNNLSSSAMDQILNDLPTRTVSDNAYINIIQNQGNPSQTAVANAEQKNWEVYYG